LIFGNTSGLNMNVDKCLFTLEEFMRTWSGLFFWTLALKNVPFLLGNLVSCLALISCLPANMLLSFKS
jgi:hypothetical protein